MPYCSNGFLDVDVAFEKYDSFCISIITYIEVLGYHFENSEEKEYIEELLDSFQIVDVDYSIAELVIPIRERKKIKLPDAIIYATAKLTQSDLITRNTQDFQNIDEEVKIVNPY
jgi:hypothetical protein